MTKGFAKGFYVARKHEGKVDSVIPILIEKLFVTHPLNNTTLQKSSWSQFSDILPQANFGEHIHHIHVQYFAMGRLQIKVDQAGVKQHVSNGFFQ